MNTIEWITGLIRHQPQLRDLHCFEISEEINDFALQLAADLWEESRANPYEERTAAPTSCWPPAPVTLVIPPPSTFGLREGAYLVFKNEEGARVALITPSGDWVRGVEVGGFVPGEGYLQPKETLTWTEDEKSDCYNVLVRLSFTLAIINEPRMVRHAPMGTRQQRRAAQRGGSFAVDAWTRVTWDISKETVAKVSRDPDFHKVPLHWRRGHFRRAEPHYRGAIQRPDALRPEDRGLWWQWIEGQWVGHPAFGVKRSVHAPKLSTGQIAKRHQLTA